MGVPTGHLAVCDNYLVNINCQIVWALVILSFLLATDTFLQVVMLGKEQKKINCSFLSCTPTFIYTFIYLRIKLLIFKLSYIYLLIYLLTHLLIYVCIYYHIYLYTPLFTYSFTCIHIETLLFTDLLLY